MATAMITAGTRHSFMLQNPPSSNPSITERHTRHSSVTIGDGPRVSGRLNQKQSTSATSHAQGRSPLTCPGRARSGAGRGR
jgi:hypothetical protein